MSNGSGRLLCVFWVFLTASMYDVAVGMGHGRKSSRVCINNTNGKVLSSVNPHVSSICRCTVKALACSVESHVAGRLDSLSQIVRDC